MVTVLLVVLLIMVLGGLPQSPVVADRGWGYGPSGLLGLVLVVLLVLLLFGRI